MLQRFLTLGDGDELPEDPNWNLVCRSRANLGFDRSRVRLPLELLVHSQANLLGVYRVTHGKDRRVLFEGLINSARMNASGFVVIEAWGWGHFLRRIRGTLKAQGVTGPELAYNVAMAAGMDPSGVQGYLPTQKRYKVTKAVKGFESTLPAPVGGDRVEPILGSDESTLIRALSLHPTPSQYHPWAATTIASTGVAAPTFWEAVDYGSARLFETVALIQYHLLSGNPQRFAGSFPIHFAPYWRTPNVSLSELTMVRELGAAKAMALSRPRIVRRAGTISQAEYEAAVALADSSAKALDALKNEHQARLRNAVHLFVRAAEARDWSTALLYYSAAADEIAAVAPKRTVLSHDDRRQVAAASEALFSAKDPRHRRVVELLKMANDRPFRRKLADVADSCGVHVSERTLRVVDNLYAMRNLYAHAGYRPPSNIYYQFTTGLSVLDQLLSQLIRTER